MNLSSRAQRAGPIASRIVAAVGGGYALAALVSVAMVALPISKPQSVLAGMLLSFLVHVAVVIWAFAARSASRAWAGLLLVAAPLLLAAWTVWTQGSVS